MNNPKFESWICPFFSLPTSCRKHSDPVTSMVNCRSPRMILGSSNNNNNKNKITITGTSLPRVDIPGCFQKVTGSVFTSVSGHEVQNRMGVQNGTPSRKDNKVHKRQLTVHGMIRESM